MEVVLFIMPTCPHEIPHVVRTGMILMKITVFGDVV
jgi:hypothetical protein